MSAKAPNRLLIIRPDAYGDLVLFEPVLRTLREAWPKTEIAVLIRERCADIGPVVAPKIQWMTTRCDPYREGADANPSALESLRRQVTEFAPDCVVAACYDKTWLEAVVATFAPNARQVSLGPCTLDLISKTILRRTCAVDWAAIYREVVTVERDTREREKNLGLTRHLIGKDVPARQPMVEVPEEAAQCGSAILQTAGLKPGDFVACCPAGAAQVTIKSWPPERFGEVVAWVEKTHRLRTLLLGHEKESATLETVRQAAHARGAAPVVWTGTDGQIAVLTALLRDSQFYVGNDTGAMHLAAALGKPVVGIFGGGTWPRFKPAARRAVCIVQPLPCFGCDWDCYFGDAPCVKEIPVEAVMKGITRVLTATGDLQEDISIDAGVNTVLHDLITKVTAVVKSRRHVRIATTNGSTELLSERALETLIEQLEFSEADRAARLAVIQQQGAEITRLSRGQGLSSEAYSTLLRRVADLDRERDKLLTKVEQAQRRHEAGEPEEAVPRPKFDETLASLEATRARAKELHDRLLEIDGRLATRLLKTLHLWRR